MEFRLIAGMRELAPQYDGFIVDLWGVIHDGVAPMPGALECLRALKERTRDFTLLVGVLLLKLERDALAIRIARRAFESGVELAVELCFVGRQRTVRAGKYRHVR